MFNTVRQVGEARDTCNTLNFANTKQSRVIKTAHVRLHHHPASQYCCKIIWKQQCVGYSGQQCDRPYLDSFGLSALGYCRRCNMPDSVEGDPLNLLI